MNKEFLAHIRKDGDRWELHYLEDHLLQVAELAFKFTNKFGAGALGYLIGLWHDLGKYKEEFQERIEIKSGHDEEAHLEGKTAKSVKHAFTGAIHAIEKFQFGAGQFFAFPIASHHSGFRDLEDLKTSVSDQTEKQALLQIKQSIPEIILNPKFQLPKLNFNDKSLFIRMLFSALIDADRLDTENFMNPDKAIQRNSIIIEEPLSLLNKKLDSFLEKLESTSQKTKVNEIRSNILQSVNSKAALQPGFFTLCVPTGGGKTLTSLSFALKHAIQHNKSRIIYAIPYISIIEQNADVFKKILGEDFVLEHHSSIEPEKENSINRLLTENWEHPLIVTTNVQLLESLFSAKTSRVRKIHNIVNSVIILDEAQMLPPDFLQPTINCLKELVERYNVSIVLCTATQPAFQTVDSINFKFKGIDNLIELAPEPEKLHQSFKRVNIHKPDRKEYSWLEIADKIRDYKQVLTIVNRKDDALELYNLLEGNKYHLSTNMCAQHRKDVLDTIKAKLKAGESIHLVSTQLIEAGVDIDFPVVFRAMTGLDSIAQSAGRCNREGKREKLGDVFVFETTRKSPKGHLLQAEQAGRSCLNDLEDLLHPDSFKRYFNELFWIKGEKGLDKKGIEDLKAKFKFEEISNEFRLIDDNSFPVVVPYKNGDSLILELKKEINYNTIKNSQRYIVNVRENAYKKLIKENIITEIKDTIAVLKTDYYSLYNEFTGLNWSNPYSYSPEDLII